MEITKEHLHIRICDVEIEAVNTQTYSEYIKEAEEEFGLESLDLDSMTSEELNEYLDFLDVLWTK